MNLKFKKKQRVYEAKDMAQLYNRKPNVWLLLEVLEVNEQGRAQKLKLLKTAKDKNDLHDYLLEMDKDWSKNYILVFSDPERQCDI